MTPIVEFRNAAKRFGGGAPVLSGITLAARPGEFVSLIGPSGCGKSTLLRLIAGLTPPDEVDALKVDASASLAFVFQEPTLLPWLTVGRNAEVMLRLRRVSAPERRARVDAALALVQLDAFADRYPRQLSGGQKMRVSLARALALNPSLLLLDEPFGALDEMTRDRLNEELLAIHGRQRWTAFFVTHSVAEAVFLSTRVIILAANPGRVAHDIAVPLSGPRNAETRLSPDYLRLVAEVSRLLRSTEKSMPSEKVGASAPNPGP